METKLRSIALGTLAFGTITLLWSVWNLYQVHANLSQILSNSTGPGYMIMIGYFTIILFHMVSFAILLFSSVVNKRVHAAHILLFVLGLLSFFAVAGEKVMFDEIAREITNNGATGEILILQGCLLLHIIFIGAMMLFLRSVVKSSGEYGASPAEREDRYFSFAHYFGIVAGALGIILSVSLLQRQVPISMLWVYLPFYGMFFVPYGIAATFWWSLKRHTSITDWYDEKQWRNILQSSLITLTLTIPGLALLFAAGKPTGYYWFPYHLSLSVFLFSIGTLYFYKRS